jgi:tetratricopeptide (TPR) repeat protein
MNQSRRRQMIRLIGSLLTGIVLPVSLTSFPIGFAQGGLAQQTATSTDPREGLLPTPVPDLAALDPSVAEQIRATAQALEEALHGAGTTAGELAEAFGVMGEIYQTYQLPASAEACYLNALKLAGDSFRWTYLLARTLETQGRLDEAVRRYEKALALEPGNVPALTHLGDANLQLGKLEESSEKYKEALKINPNCAAALAGAGQVALKQRDFQAAAAALRRALELAPAANRLHYLLAMAYRGLGDQENGKAHLAQSGSVGVRVDDPIEKELENLLQGERTHMVRGRLAFNAGRYQESIQEFRQALAARPDSCGARVNLASALASAGKVDEALSEYEAAAGPCPDSAVLHFNLGRLYLEKGILDKAFEEYRRSLELNPNDLAALLALAQISTRQEAVDQAAEYLSTAVGMHPDSEEAWYELSGFLLGRKEYARARDRLEEACGRLPTAGRLVELLARLLAACPDLSLRNGARAIELAERVYAAAPTVYHAETLALALAETGRCEEAAAVLQKSIPVLEESGKYPDLLARMRKDLQRYRQGQPCRPPE